MSPFFCESSYNQKLDKGGRGVERGLSIACHAPLLEARNRMGNCIIAVVILGTDSLVAWLDNGTSKRYTALDLGIDSADDFASVRISADGTALQWNNGEGISSQDLIELGKEVNYVEEEKHRLLKTLSEIRREASFSQTRLGEAAGIRQSVISRIEGCEISPQINTLLKLLAPLGKTLAIVDLEDRG